MKTIQTHGWHVVGLLVALVRAQHEGEERKLWFPEGAGIERVALGDGGGRGRGQ